MSGEWDRVEQFLAQVTANSEDYLAEHGYASDEDPISVLINDDVLEIRREQVLVDGKWTDTRYTFVIGTGGPHVEFDTNYVIAVFNPGKSHVAVTHDEHARETIDRVYDYMEELYGK